MDNNDNPSAYTPNLPPSTEAERDAVYTATQEAIKSRDMKRAHNLLLKMIQVDGNNPELWLLLAWTAPSKAEAGIFFEHLLRIQPDYPLAICGVAWSGVEWSSGESTQVLESQIDEKSSEQAAQTIDSPGKKSLARQTGELASSIASFVSKPMRRRTGELKPAAEHVEHEAGEEQPDRLISSSTPEDDRSLKGWKADLPPVVASTASKSLSEWASEKQPSKTNVNQPKSRKQAEWLEPAAWTVEKAAQDYPRTDDHGTGIRIQRKRLPAGLSSLGLAVFLGLYLLSIASAELVTAYRSHILGLVYHGVLLILMLIFALFISGVKEKKLLLALGLAPLIRLVSLTTHLLGLDFPASYVAIGITLLIAAYLVIRAVGLKPGQVGLTWGKALLLQLIVGVAGIGLGFIEYLILRPEPLALKFSLLSILSPALALFIFPGFTEELIFRGLMQRGSTGIYKKLGPIYIALLYSVLHIGYKSWLDLIFVFLVGLFFSILVEKTRSLVGVTLAHGLASVCLFLVFPFVLAAPAQKLDFLPAPVAQVSGPAIWSAPFSRYSPPAEIITPSNTNTPTTTPTATDASSMPGPALTLPATWTLTATWTSTPSPTFTLTPTVTRTPTIVSTSTSTSTPRPTLRFTSTPTRTATTVPLPSSTATALPSPTRTLNLTPTPTPTITPIPTDVLITDEPTFTPTP